MKACLSVPGKELTLWQGESGRASGKCAHVTCPSQYNQAKFAVRRYIGDAGEGLGLSSLFTASDFMNYYADGSDQFYGALTVRDVHPKLVYFTMQGLGGLLEGLEPYEAMMGYFSVVSPARIIEETSTFHNKFYGFVRKGVPVLAIWRQGHVDLSHTPVTGKLNVFLNKKVDWSHPIVIDPIRRNVYAIKEFDPSNPNLLNTTGLTVKRFPLADYPLFVTDLSIFNDYLK